MRKTATIAVNVLATCALALGIAGAANAQQSTTTAPSGTTAKKPTGTTKLTSTATKSAAGAALTTDKQKQSYALGMNIARGLTRQKVDVDPAIVARGLRDTMSGGKPLL
ncbi:MAG: FKBP-type peptidyl-prolyl cis-trans isomerase N-terminal domain-containing protein, partial [Candidatus Acidiferrales bacterium]